MVRYLILLVCLWSFNLQGTVALKQQQALKSTATRIFEGRIQKLGFFESLSSHFQYGLFQKKKCIAFLVCKDSDRRMLDSFKRIEGRSVVIKGVPQYVNRSPYLLITVEDVCEQ